MVMAFTLQQVEPMTGHVHNLIIIGRVVTKGSICGRGFYRKELTYMWGIVFRFLTGETGYYSSTVNMADHCA
jgi:hypothetical protein